MVLRIKNMCCPRCIDAVKSILVQMGLTVSDVFLGEAIVEETLTTKQETELSARLKERGFELLDDPRSCLVEAIRVAVLQWVRKENCRQKLSDYITQQLNRDYSSLSKLFSQVRGITLEHYAIQHRVEYAKELLSYSIMTISEIAYQLGYSSPAHFASQFKQFTGMSPKAFRELGSRNRRFLDEF